MAPITDQARTGRVTKVTDDQLPVIREEQDERDNNELFVSPRTPSQSDGSSWLAVEDTNSRGANGSPSPGATPREDMLQSLKASVPMEAVTSYSRSLFEVIEQSCRQAIEGTLKEPVRKSSPDPVWKDYIVVSSGSESDDERRSLLSAVSFDQLDDTDDAVRRPPGTQSTGKGLQQVNEGSPAATSMGTDPSNDLPFREHTEQRPHTIGSPHKGKYTLKRKTSDIDLNNTAKKHKRASEREKKRKTKKSNGA